MTDDRKIIRVGVADDSPFICRLLTQYLESDPDIKVIGVAGNGKEAVDIVRKQKPDVLTLDLNMPVLDGLGALGQIMAQYPMPVLLITGVSKKAAQMTEKGLALGATDFIFKYSGDAAIPPESLRREIIAKVKAGARVKVIRHIPRISSGLGIRGSGLKVRDSGFGERGPRDEERISKLTVIGASTGGPLALKELLISVGQSKKFADNPFPIVIVQHMPQRFTKILAAQFDRFFPFPVKEAEDGDSLIPGTVLIAPGNRHLLIHSNGAVHTTMTPEINGHRPSIDVTMQSAAQVFASCTRGVVLSGMGDDGTKGLWAIKNNCGNTFAQSGETCVIDTMPHSAVRKEVAERVGSPSEIGKWLSD